MARGKNAKRLRIAQQGILAGATTPDGRWATKRAAENALGGPIQG
jgi:hypothetical protein